MGTIDSNEYIAQVVAIMDRFGMGYLTLEETGRQLLELSMELMRSDEIHSDVWSK